MQIDVTLNKPLSNKTEITADFLVTGEPQSSQ